MTRAGLFIFLASVAGFVGYAHGRCSRPGSPFVPNTLSGTIESPGYPDSYEAYEACDWSLNPPPKTHPEILIMDIVKVDTNIDHLPQILDVCNYADSFVELSRVRACGTEDSVCLAFLLSSSSIDCHVTIAREYSNCQNVLHTSWPFPVSFRTGVATNNAGFKLNYKFVTCSSDPPPQETSPTSASGNFTSSVANAAVTTTTEKLTPVATTRASTVVPAARTNRTLLETTIETILSRETKSPQGVSRAGAADEKVVIGLLIGLIIFLILVAVIVAMYRRNILDWVERKKWSPRSSKREPSAGHYTEAQTSSSGAEGAYEEPMVTRRPPMPPPYPPMIEENGKPNHNGNNGILNGSANGKTTTLNGPLTISNAIYETCE